ncbi:hypothetical protein FOXYS1_14341 [Fusarium oxysporum]|uniref:Uncharacterized protein n=1 Tax=Fusarium oxysporum TaxID=5507 RepID=A0A8H5EC94_FUSOX|nr:hypothetical protein FOXYS1_14341 [Fusarium oxysporum]
MRLRGSRTGSMEHECGWEEAGPDSEKSEVADRLNEQARERLDRGSQDPEVREDSFFSVTTALTTMAEDAKSYAEDIQVLEHLDEDDKVTVLSATMPLALLSGETDATGHGTRAPVPSTGLSENSTSQTASDGDNEGTVLKTLKSRKATSAWVQPNQTVIAAYHDEDMLDSNDEPHQVPVHGTYFDNVWTPGNSGSTVTNGDMRIVRKYVRASRLFIPRDGAKHMPDRLPVEIPGPESATPAVYVGISRVAIQHVFMRNKAKVNKVSFADNTESFDLRAEPSNVVAGINTIFHEGCTVPGNISRLKRFVKDKTTVFEEQPAPMERLVRQNNRVLQYLPIEPVQNRKASDDAGHQPSYRIVNRRELETILIGFILPRTWDV